MFSVLFQEVIVLEDHKAASRFLSGGRRRKRTILYQVVNSMAALAWPRLACHVAACPVLSAANRHLTYPTLTLTAGARRLVASVQSSATLEGKTVLTFLRYCL